MSLPPPPPPPPEGQGSQRPGSGQPMPPPPQSRSAGYNTAGVRVVTEPGQKLGTFAFALGLAGLIPMCGFLPAIAAIILGLSASRGPRAAGLKPHWTAGAGVVLGGIGIAISLLTILALANSGP